MLESLEALVGRWARRAGIAPSRLPSGDWLDRCFGGGPGVSATRPGVLPERIAGWEREHGFELPDALKAWLELSDGLYAPRGPLVHPLRAIGPMIPFARVPELVVQPESWFEIGNPGPETICIDLAYRWPGGDHPLFLSGDDEQGTPPRLIATGFAPWLLRLLREAGEAYWYKPGFRALGDPWEAHRQRTPIPPLPERLKPLAGRIQPLMRAGADDRTIATVLGITRGDVEAIFRHLQHGLPL